jgi:16S rRNA (cytosine1402-N4)-methyltransferase
MQHVPVLLHESIDALAAAPGAVVVDATLGAGGHASELGRTLSSAAHVIGFDVDENAIALATEAVAKSGATLTVVRSNFRHMQRELAKLGIQSVDAVLFDLGVSSLEFGASGRGFSFKYDEPLLMTLDSHPDEDMLTAADIVNGESEEALADIIYKYGEERFSRRIAKEIVTARRHKRIETTFELVDIIKRAVPASYRNGRLHPATRTFQALRIATNDELGALKDGLEDALRIVRPGGRVAVITFHSLEDRIVKETFKKYKEEGMTLITKKPIVPTREEIISNPRARSAKLRIIQK